MRIQDISSQYQARGIPVTNPYTDYKVINSIDNGKKIEIHVAVLHLRTYKENADFSESNTHYVEGSKTLSSYDTNVYTADFIKFSSEAALNSTKEDLKNYIVRLTVFTRFHLKSGYSTKPEKKIKNNAQLLQ